MIEKVELICKLRSVNQVMSVISLRLAGWALAVHQQLGDKKKNAGAVLWTILQPGGYDRFLKESQLLNSDLIKLFFDRSTTHFQGIYFCSEHINELSQKQTRVMCAIFQRRREKCKSHPGKRIEHEMLTWVNNIPRVCLSKRKMTYIACIKSRCQCKSRRVCKFYTRFALRDRFWKISNLISVGNLSVSR